MVPKDDGPFFLGARIIDPMDDWVMFLKLDIHHDEMVEPVEQTVWNMEIAVQKLPLKGFFLFAHENHSRLSLC